MKKIFLSTRNNKVPIVVGNGIISSKLLSKYIKSKNVLVITTFLKLENNFTNYEEIDKSDNNNFSQEFNSNRPPERDVRESQPTISVNYRFVDQDNNSYRSQETAKTINNSNNEDNDWVNFDNEW